MRLEGRRPAVQFGSIDGVLPTMIPHVSPSHNGYSTCRHPRKKKDIMYKEK
jgi:hypothetical protein